MGEGIRHPGRRDPLDRSSLLRTPRDATRQRGVFATLDADIRETRYGFGRERRLRLAFASTELGPSIQREAARRHDAVLIGPRQLAGED